ncbi:MAG: hypothetical protein AABZ02_10005 [Bacteroidota bacterium]
MKADIVARHAHGTEIAARTFRRADELFPEDEAILTRRIGTLWTYAELWRVASKNEYPKILELTAGLFADRYVKRTIPPDPERGYAIYAGLASLRLVGRGNEAVALRFGRIVEANLEPGELALAVACGYADMFGRGPWHNGDICRWSEARLRRVAGELSRAGVDPLELVHVVYMGRE